MMRKEREEAYEVCESDQHELSSRPDVKVVGFDRECRVGSGRDREFEVRVWCIELLVIESARQTSFN